MNGTIALFSFLRNGYFVCCRSYNSKAIEDKSKHKKINRKVFQDDCGEEIDDGSDSKTFLDDLMNII